MDHLIKVFYFSCFLIVVISSGVDNNGFVKLNIIPEELGNEILLQNSYNRAGRIVMGSLAVTNQFPYYGYAVLYLSTYQTFCGSSLISSTWVVTAAHCMANVSAAIIYFGSTDKQYMKVSRNAQGYIVHESFDKPSALVNDIALIKLTSAVPFSKSVAVVKLPARSETTKSFNGVALTSCGFGKTETNYPRYLQFTTIEGLANNECLRYHWVFRNSMLCGKGSNDTGSAVCFGDSGTTGFSYNNF